MDSAMVRVGVLALALGVALVLGVWWRRAGVLRPSRAGAVLTGADLGSVGEPVTLGERATTVLLSSSVCSACSAARAVLRRAGLDRPGVAQVEVSAEDHLDLARRLGVLRTPTVLVLDATGRVVWRSGGAPALAAVEGALDELGALRPGAVRPAVVGQARRG